MAWRFAVPAPDPCRVPAPSGEVSAKPSTDGDLVMRTPKLICLVVLGVLAGLAPVTASADVGSCNPNTWFIAVVSDAEQTNGAPRSDFEVDVDNFELFRENLQETYCFDDSHVKILAFKNAYERNGVTYEKATETAVKNQIAAFGAAASLAPNPQLFFILSSHGIVYPRTTCPNGGRRVGGSLAALQSGGPNNGDLEDCELGHALNTSFPTDTEMVVMVDCSVCGGFSDSLTAASGTVPDLALPTPSGILGPNRIVITGCAVTTECFGGRDGAILYGHMRRIINAGIGACDGFTVPHFPLVQGIDLPEQTGARDGVCATSEPFFAAVDRAYDRGDLLGIQEQPRIKYGFATLAEDIAIF